MYRQYSVWPWLQMGTERLRHDIWLVLYYLMYILFEDSASFILRNVTTRNRTSRIGAAWRANCILDLQLMLNYINIPNYLQNTVLFIFKFSQFNIKHYRYVTWNMKLNSWTLTSSMRLSLNIQLILQNSKETDIWKPNRSKAYKGVVI
jgi:hypothetical protein